MDTSIGVKQEEGTSEMVVLEDRFLELFKKFPSGLPDKQLQEETPNVSANQRVAVINKLLSTGKLLLCQQPGTNVLVYKYRDLESTTKVQGANSEEKILYQIIEDSGNKGIWIRDIRNKSNLSMTLLSKVLKVMEGKKLIKAVKSVAASKKKVYMIYNLEPDKSLTGGAWYSEQEFESEFVEVLNQQCYKYLQMRLVKTSQDTNSNPIERRKLSQATVHEVWAHISQLGISKVELSVDDIEMILKTLIYDGTVMQTADLKGAVSVKVYRACDLHVPVTGLVRIPCGVCPVINQCTDGGAISPITCVYFNDW